MYGQRRAEAFAVNLHTHGFHKIWVKAVRAEVQTLGHTSETLIQAPHHYSEDTYFSVESQCFYLPLCFHKHLFLPVFKEKFAMMKKPFWGRELDKLGFPGGSALMNLLLMQEMWGPSLDQGDPVEEEMATHFNILAWKILWTEEPGKLQSMGLQRVRYNWITYRYPTL